MALNSDWATHRALRLALAQGTGDFEQVGAIIRATPDQPRGVVGLIVDLAQLVAMTYAQGNEHWVRDLSGQCTRLEIDAAMSPVNDEDA